MAEKSKAVATGFEAELMAYRPQMEAALPKHIPVAKFERVVITALNQTPDLVKADRRSLFISCVRAAQEGVLPDGREAALVVYSTKNQQTGEYEKRVQLLVMVAGLRKRMRQSGEVTTAEAHVVHEHDEFSYTLGDTPSLTHKPKIKDRGDPIGAYAIIKLTNGEILRDFMNVGEIEYIRGKSRAGKSGPWVDFWGEMARKTVLRRLSKSAPMTAEIEETFKRDDAYEIEHEVIAQSPPPRPTRPQIEQQVPVAQDYIIIMVDGAEMHCGPNPGDAATAFISNMQAARKLGKDHLDGLWESNPLSGQLRDDGYPELAEAIHAEYAALMKREDPKPVVQTFDMPPSPLGNKKAEWPTWVVAACAAIKAAEFTGREQFMATYNKEIDFVEDNRVADWRLIQEALRGE